MLVVPMLVGVLMVVVVDGPRLLVVIASDVVLLVLIPFLVLASVPFLVLVPSSSRFSPPRVIQGFSGSVSPAWGTASLG